MKESDYVFFYIIRSHVLIYYVKYLENMKTEKLITAACEVTVRR